MITMATIAVIAYFIMLAAIVVLLIRWVFSH